MTTIFILGWTISKAALYLYKFTPALSSLRPYNYLNHGHNLIFRLYYYVEDDLNVPSGQSENIVSGCKHTAIYTTVLGHWTSVEDMNPGRWQL